MSAIKTPEQIASQYIEDDGSDMAADYRAALVGAIRADRAQRRPEIYIVQDEDGDVLDVFRDRDEAEAAFAPSLDAGTASVIEETVTEPGEYAAPRIAELSREWEEAVNYGGDENVPHFAADYVLSEDDWRVGLSDDDAREIAALIEWQEAQK